jgi:hypothetical protein
MSSPDASVAQHAQFYAQHGSLLGVTNYLLTLPVPFFVLFLGGLFGVLRRTEGFVGTLTVAAMLAGAAMVMIWPFGMLLTSVGPSIVTNGGDHATAWAFDGMAPLSLALSAFPRAVLLGATSLVLLDSRLIPRWIGWLGLGLVPISLIGTATLVIGELFPFLGIGTLVFAIWVLTLSSSLLRSTRAARKAIAQAGAL